MTDKEKLLKLRKLADAMYYAAQYLTTDASKLHKAMDKYHQFIIHEYHKEEPTIPDIVDEHYWEMLGEEPVSEDLWESSKRYALLQVLASTDAEMTEQAYLSLKLFSGFEIAVAHKDGANWQKQKDKSKVLTEEQCRKIRDDAFELGKDAMKQQMMANAVDGAFIRRNRYTKKNVLNGLDMICDAIQGFKDKDKIKVLFVKED